MQKPPRTFVVVTATVILVAGCGSTKARTCRQSGGAEFCLIESGQAYRAEGEGFAPGSTVTITVEDSGNSPSGEPTFQADEDGKVPARGARAGVLLGPSPQRVTVAGTARTGDQVSFEFTVPAAGR
jgi:hypothetical protein